MQTADGALEGMVDRPALATATPRSRCSRPWRSVFREPPGGSPRNVLAARVTEIEPYGDRIRVRAAGLSADVTAEAVAELDLVPGADVIFSVKATEVAVYRS